MNDTLSPPAEEQPTGELLEPSDYSQYLLYNSGEILNVLKALIESGAQITVFFNDGKDLLLTTLIAADPKTGLVFDYGSTALINQRAEKASKLFCIASLDKVKIQFILRGLTTIQFEGRPAFKAASPESVLRLQRREYYRLTMPVTRPLVCNVPVDDGTGQNKILAFNAVDISGGGVALAFSANGPGLETDKDYPGCSMDLPEVGTVVATLRIKSVFDVTLRSGAVLQRAGCQFVNLPGPMMTLIQRYIIKVERERKARESGLS